MKLAIIFLLLIPFSFAIECSQFPNPSECDDVMSSSLDLSEQQYLLSSLLANSQNKPPCSFVRDWNLALDTSIPPEGVEKRSKGQIRNAWVKLFTVMPSVKEEKLLIGSNGSMLVGFGYDFQMPYGRLNGDCRTDYNYLGNSVAIDGYVNDEYVGSGRVIDYETSIDSSFKVVYKVKEKYLVSHHKYYWHCCRWKRGHCKSWCRKCGFKYADEIHESLSVSDSLFGYFSDYALDASFVAIDSYLGNTKGVLNSTNYSRLSLLLDSGNLSFHNYEYSVVWDNSSVLTIKARSVPTVSSVGIVRNNETIMFEDSSKCSIFMSNHFSNMNFDCNFTFDQVVPLIKLDKDTFDVGETISVRLEPSDIDFNVSYGNTSRYVHDSTSFVATNIANRIVLRYNDREYDQLIIVKNKDKSMFMLSLSVFGTVNYVIIELLKRYFGMHL